MSRRAWVLAALFVSGLAGLMHEVIWAKFLIALIGNTAHSNAVVLTVFMAGLALGAVAFGKRSDTWKRPLYGYAILEILIGVYCLVLPFLLKLAGGAYEFFAAKYFDQSGLLLFLRFLLSVAIVLPPAVLMGATLPILAKHLVEDVSQTRRHVAALYAMNNLGAVLGSGVAGFFTLPLYGIYGSLGLASAANFVAAAMVFKVHADVTRGATPQPTPAEPAPEPALAQASYSLFQVKATLVALLFSGFAAMAYEVVLLRVIALSFGSSTYSFTVMLMCFITGIGVGSAILSSVKVRKPLLLLGISQLAVVVAFVVVTPLIARLPYLLGLMRIHFRGSDLGFEQYQIGKAVLCLAVFLVPTLCIGISFPVVTQVQARSLSRIGRTVGSTYAWNTAGNVLGVMLTSLVLIPLVGIGVSFELGLAASLLAGLLILLAANEARLPVRIGASALAVVALLIYAGYGRGWPDPINLATNHLRLREPSFHARFGEQEADTDPSTSFEAWKSVFLAREELCDRFFLDEDENNTALAYEIDDGVELFVNGKGDASTRLGDLINQTLLGQVPMFCALDAKTTLVIGHGSGITSGCTILHPVEKMDIVEISSGVMAADGLFTQWNGRVLEHPAVEVHVDDARTFLRTVPRKYDVIISVPSNPWIAGIGGLFSQEFFQDVKARLNPGGVLCMWFHQYEQDDEACRLVMRTLKSVFPEVEMFHSFLADVMAIASVEPIEPDFAAMEARFNQPSIRRNFNRVGILNLASLLAHHTVSSTRFPDLPGEGPINRDRHQLLEYRAPRHHFLDTTATVVSDFDGWATTESGRTDSWFDQYIAYREAEGEPVFRQELEWVATILQFILRDDAHRIHRLIAERLEQSEPVSVAPEGAARGGPPVLTTLSLGEALGLGPIYADAGLKVDAARLYERALEIAGSNRDAALALGALYLDLDRAADAVAIVDRELALLSPGSPPDTELSVRLAQARLQLGELEAASAVLDGLEPSLEILVLSADVLVLRGMSDEALFLYERALAEAPSAQGLVEKLVGFLSSRPGGEVRALEILDEAVARHPLNKSYRALRSELVGGD